MGEVESARVTHRDGIKAIDFGLGTLYRLH